LEEIDESILTVTSHFSFEEFFLVTTWNFSFLKIFHEILSARWKGSIKNEEVVRIPERCAAEKLNEYLADVLSVFSENSITSGHLRLCYLCVEAANS
jgi:hypothetical protein